MKVCAGEVAINLVIAGEEYASLSAELMMLHKTLHAA
jgi:hypothetical protein